jgi:ABC-2 type transport system permease protein
MEQMLWYLVATEAFILSSPKTWMEVEQDVRSGRIAVLLIHPMSYALTHLSKALGERIPRFVVSLIVGSLIATVLVGPISWTPTGVAMFLCILPSAFLLDFLGSFLIGLCAFWMESVNGIALIYTRAMMLLGGVMLPIEIYPDWLQPVLRRLPFSSMVYAPGRMFVDPGVRLFGDALDTQLIAVAIYASVAGFVHHTALKRVFTNGG